MSAFGVFCQNFFETKPRFMSSRLWRVIKDRANPRSQEYMSDLFFSRYPDGKLLKVKSPDDLLEVKSESSKVVLLYPDSIGLGFHQIEKTVLVGRSWKEVEVLNGRRRLFSLNKETLFGLRLKRLLEVTMLPELVFAPLFLVCCTILLATDHLGGKK